MRISWNRVIFQVGTWSQSITLYLITFRCFSRSSVRTVPTQRVRQNSWWFWSSVHKEERWSGVCSSYNRWECKSFGSPGTWHGRLHGDSGAGSRRFCSSHWEHWCPCAYKRWWLRFHWPSNWTVQLNSEQILQNRNVPNSTDQLLFLERTKHIYIYKKVLLRERKRHTARRIAIAISCYCRERGVPWQKNFFPVWTCIKPNLVSKIFPFTGRGVPRQKFFFPVWTCIKPNLVSKNFPFTGGGGVPQQKIFFSVWTCIKPNLVSKNFPFTGGGGSLNKKFFSQSEHVSSQIWCQNFSLYWDQVPPPPKKKCETWDPPQKCETWDPPKNLRPRNPSQKSETWDPPRKSETWDPPRKSETWDPPYLDMGPPPKVWTDTQTGVKTLPSLVLCTRAVIKQYWWCVNLYDFSVCAI